jgi:serine/threonine protein kinase/Flp pilus assembly protein TadD
MSEPEPVAALCAEQRRRWQQGDRIPVEAYLERRPALRQRPEAVLDLIYNEVVVREEHADRPRLEEYLKRFPELADELRRQFEVHQAIEGADSDDGVLTSITSLMSAAPPPAAPAPPERLAVPGYEILAELGRGGMGVVYKARQLSLKRPVALKMILGGARAGPQERARFRTEAEAVARLQHPNIVQIYEVGEHEGILYCALELVDGPGLEKVLGGRPQPVGPAARLAETLARALQHAHLQGIIHRDLKPSNVLLRRKSEVQNPKSETNPDTEIPCPKTDTAPVLDIEDSDFGFRISDFEPKVGDFGLAKLLDAGAAQTPTQDFLGTPSYMAPEQAAGRAREAGPPADVYSLGAILYEMLTGRPPFIGDTALQTLENVWLQEPAPPRRLRPDLPRDLETICLQCLEKEPARRYASAEELADDLARFLGNEPIHARPAGAWERLRKWARRRPAAAALAAVSCAAVLGLVLLGVWHSTSLRDTEDQTRLSEGRRRAEAGERYQKFIGKRDEALFPGLYGRQFSDADLAGERQAAEAAAREALALVGVTLGGKAVAGQAAYLSEREQADIAAGCYQMLVVLAEAVAYSLPGQSPEERRRQAGQALVLLEQAAGFVRPGPAYHLGRARYLDQLGDKGAARREREQAAAATADSAVDCFLLGMEHLRQGDYRGARRDFQDALELQPDDFWSRLLFAACCLKAGDVDDARVNLARCARQRPEFIWTYLVQAHAEKDLTAAEAHYHKALEKQPGDEARYVLHLDRGRLRLAHKLFAGAIADLQQAATLKPEDGLALLLLARAYQGQGSLDESEKQLDRALGLKPAPAVAAECLVEQARNRYRAGKYAEALRACDAALEKYSTCAGAHYLRGQVLLELHSPGAALTAFKAYQDEKGEENARFYLWRGRARLQAGDYLGARDDANQALAREPSVAHYALRGWAYFFADAWKPALGDFEKALQGDRLDPDALTGRGLARVMLGAYRQAVADATKALDLPPRSPEQLHNVACIFALGVGKVESDPGAPDRQAVAADYRCRAVQTLRRALALVAPAKRRAFWHDKVLPDRALDPIRNSREFQELAKSYGPPGAARRAKE